MIEKEIFEEKFLSAKFIGKEIEDQIIKEGILTGSYAFGCQTNQSDIDIIMMFDGENFFQCCQDSFYYDKPYSYSESINYYVKFRSYDRPVNIIFFQEKFFYDVWKNANDKFIKIINESNYFKELIKDRYNRVELFESFKRIEEEIIRRNFKQNLF